MIVLCGTRRRDWLFWSDNVSHMWWKQRKHQLKASVTKFMHYLLIMLWKLPSDIGSYWQRLELKVWKSWSFSSLTFANHLCGIVFYLFCEFICYNLFCHIAWFYYWLSKLTENCSTILILQNCTMSLSHRISKTANQFDIGAQMVSRF